MKICSEIAIAVRELSVTTKSKLDTLPKNDSDIVISETAENRGWCERTWNAITRLFTTAGNGLTRFVNYLTATHLTGENFEWKIFLPEANLALEDGRLFASTDRIEFNHLIYQSTDATLSGSIAASEKPFAGNSNWSIGVKANYKEQNINSTANGTLNFSNSNLSFMVDWSTLFTASNSFSFGTDMTAMLFPTSNRMLAIDPVIENGITSFTTRWFNSLKMGVFIRIKLR